MPDQTAMLLTQQEWTDLANMARLYRRSTAWVEREDVDNPKYVNLNRRRQLAQRIIDAAED